MKTFKIVRNTIIGLYAVVMVIAIVFAFAGLKAVPAVPASTYAEVPAGSLLVVGANGATLFSVPLLGYAVHYLWTLPGKICLGVLLLALIITFCFDKKNDTPKKKKGDKAKEDVAADVIAASAITREKQGDSELLSEVSKILDDKDPDNPVQTNDTGVLEEIPSDTGTDLLIPVDSNQDVQTAEPVADTSAEDAVLSVISEDAVIGSELDEAQKALFMEEISSILDGPEAANEITADDILTEKPAEEEPAEAEPIAETFETEEETAKLAAAAAASEEPAMEVSEAASEAPVMDAAEIASEEPAVAETESGIMDAHTEDLERRVAELEAEKGSLIQKLSIKADENEELRRKAEDAVASLEELNSLKDAIARLEEERALDAVSAANAEESARQAEELQDLLAQEREAKEALKEELSAKSDEYREQIESLKADLDTVENSKIERYEDEIEGLKKQLSEVSEKAKDDIADIDDYKKQLEEVRSEKEQESTKVSALEERLVLAAKMSSSDKARIAELESMLEESRKGGGDVKAAASESAAQTSGDYDLLCDRYLSVVELMVRNKMTTQEAYEREKARFHKGE